MSELEFHLKKSQFDSLLATIQSFSELTSKSSEIRDSKLMPSIASTLGDINLPASVTEVPSSLSVNLDLLFKAFKFSLLNEDDSPHTAFDLTYLSIGGRLIEHKVALSFDINRLSAVSGDRKIVDFELADGRCVHMAYNLVDSLHEINLVSAKPLIIVDFRWIREVQAFFQVPEREPVKVVKNSDRNESSEVFPSRLIAPALQKEETRFKVHVSITNPSFSLILVGKAGPIAMAFGMDLVKVFIGDDQNGSIDVLQSTNEILCNHFHLILVLFSNQQLSLILDLKNFVSHLKFGIINCSLK
jgi:hypothetical protein